MPFSHKDQIKDRSKRPFPPEGISRRLQAIIMKCLEKDRRKRFQDMQEVLTTLNTVTITVKKKPKKPGPKQKKKTPILNWAASAALIIAVIVVANLIHNLQTPRNEPTPSPESAQVQEENQNEKNFKVYLKQAEMFLKKGDTKRARQQLGLAKKIKSTPELQALEAKIAEGEIRKKKLEEQDDPTFASASKSKTIAAYDSYLKQYS